MLFIIALLLLIGIVLLGAAITGKPPIELFRSWIER